MSMRTINHDLFLFREDNRERINHSHVKRLAESIKARNLLSLRPIIVNDKMEIIDGQHRLLAAKSLGIEVYYKIESDLGASDIISMNISKPWGISDYFNFYCYHKYPEYMKLADFMKTNELKLKIALSLCMGGAHVGYDKFRDGQFKFEEEALGGDLTHCWDTIHYIKKMRGHCPYTLSSRFWKALLMLVRSPNFDSKKWTSNMAKMIHRFEAQASFEDYRHMLQSVYNWSNSNPINLASETI